MDLVSNEEIIINNKIRRKFKGVLQTWINQKGIKRNKIFKYREIINGDEWHKW